MKKILYHSAFAFLAAFLLGACSPEDFSGANGELPNIADYAVQTLGTKLPTSKTVYDAFGREVRSQVTRFVLYLLM